MSDVNALKDQGNKAFAAKDYDKAIELFTAAIAIDPSNHVLFSNRSAAKAGKKEWATALEDAEQVCPIIFWSGMLMPSMWLLSVSNSISRGPKATQEKGLLCTVQDDMTRLSRHLKLVLNLRIALPYARVYKRCKMQRVGYSRIPI
ncbi:hypothetical protein BDR07DRAFT_359140 [Suillus spraguei]|nr:hypothetical protein BDR07DRAFT_359140 [Suillus spraguei]